jgi:hypothetical protein
MPPIKVMRTALHDADENGITDMAEGVRVVEEIPEEGESHAGNIVIVDKKIYVRVE